MSTAQAIEEPVSLACEITCPHAHTPEEAERLIKVPARTLRDKAGRREIPFTKIGRQILFTDGDLTDILRAGAHRPAPPRPDSRRHS